MKLWIKIISGAIPAAATVLAILLLLLRRRRRQQKLISPETSTDFSDTTAISKFDNLQTSTNKIHLPPKPGSSARNSLRFHHLHHQPPPPPPPQLPAAAAFRWDEHPHLITDAAQNGWQSFSFANSVPDRRPTSGPLWALCAACDADTQQDSPETGSMFTNGSSELMQSVRLNPSDDLSSFSSIRTRLPLPGPSTFTGGSFPQEAYFEITIVFLNQLLSSSSMYNMDNYSDRSKLIRENSDNVGSAPQNSDFAAGKGRSSDFTMALGLTSRTSLRNQLMPGTYPESIGFHSDGSLHLDGTKLVLESEKAEWAAVNRVVGCGFEPRNKKVFFTVDCQISHVMRCTSEQYTNPLFPVLAANVEVSILVNMGQAPFKYAPANASRKSNPCFLRLVSGKEGGEKTVGSVESRELFPETRTEMERTGCERRRNSSASLDDVLDGELDLFEIALQW